MAVNVQAKGQGGITLGGNLDLAQFGASSPAVWSAGLLILLLVAIVLIAMGLR